MDRKLITELSKETLRSYLGKTHKHANDYGGWSKEARLQKKAGNVAGEANARKKAKVKLANNYKAHARLRAMSGQPATDRMDSKATNSGLMKAHNKMPKSYIKKESVDLQELSKIVLGRYRKKIGASVKELKNNRNELEDKMLAAKKSVKQLKPEHDAVVTKIKNREHGKLLAAQKMKSLKNK